MSTATIKKLRLMPLTHEPPTTKQPLTSGPIPFYTISKYTISQYTTSKYTIPQYTISQKEEPREEKPLDKQPVAPPKWKMCVITLLPAYVLSVGLVSFLKQLLSAWPFLMVNIVVTVALVFLLTYVIHPLAMRLFHSWLFSRK